MKDNLFFKVMRGIQWVTLCTAPFAAAYFTKTDDFRNALMALAAWAMVVTAMLVIKKPKEIGHG